MRDGVSGRSARTVSPGAAYLGRVMALLALLAVSILVAGCGQSGAAAPTATVPAATALTTSTNTSVSSVDIDAVFEDLAASVEPLTIFAPTYLPTGAALADGWLPVVDSADPASYDGPPNENPRIVGTGADAEVQVLFQVGEGWLAILENFQGDLGDVSGTPVGDVAGNPAFAYEVNGGHLVQWSKDGRWYGVFGRGVGLDEVTAAALGMQAKSGEAG